MKNVFDLINIILITYILLFLFKNNNTLSNFTKVKKYNNNEKNNDNKKNNHAIHKKNHLENRDRKVIDDKLYPPEQRHEGHNYFKIEKAMKINEHTRGEPENYQVVGLLYKEDGDKKYQLFGRKIYPGAYEWEYYIGGKDSGGLDYKYPLETKQEIYDNTTINNPIDNDVYNVKIYNFDKPRYIPYIIP